MAGNDNNPDRKADLKEIDILAETLAAATDSLLQKQITGNAITESDLKVIDGLARSLQSLVRRVRTED